MTEIKIYNGENLVKTLESVTPNMFIITPDKEGLKTMFTTNRMRINDECSIDQSFLAIIRQLLKIYPNQLSHIKPERIMVIIDEKFKGPSPAVKKEPWKSQLKYISHVGRFMGDMFNFDYVLKLRSYWLNEWSEAQLNANILSQLLLIQDPTGTILDYNETHISKMVATFGRNYLEPNIKIQNVLEDMVELHEFKIAPQAQVQTTIDEILEPFEPELQDQETQEAEEAFEKALDRARMATKGVTEDGPTL